MPHLEKKKNQSSMNFVLLALLLLFSLLTLSVAPPPNDTRPFYLSGDNVQHTDPIELGQGTFAKVIHYKNTLQAVKQFKNTSSNKVFFNEFNALSNFRYYPGITHMFGAHPNEAIRMEYANGGDMRTFYKNRPSSLFTLSLSLRQFSLIFFDIVLGFTFLHRSLVAHHDFKPDNVVLYLHRPVDTENTERAPTPKNYLQKDLPPIDFDSENYYRALLADFSVARREKGKSTACTGTKLYFSPEKAKFCFLGTSEARSRWSENVTDGYDAFKADIYAIGLTMYEVLYGSFSIRIAQFRSKFPGQKDENLLYQIPEIKEERNGESKVLREIKRLMKILLHPEPAKRPNAITCLERLRVIVGMVFTDIPLEGKRPYVNVDAREYLSEGQSLPRDKHLPTKKYLNKILARSDLTSFYVRWRNHFLSNSEKPQVDRGVVEEGLLRDGTEWKPQPIDKSPQPINKPERHFLDDSTLECAIPEEESEKKEEDKRNSPEGLKEQKMVSALPPLLKIRRERAIQMREDPTKEKFEAKDPKLLKKKLDFNLLHVIDEKKISLPRIARSPAYPLNKIPTPPIKRPELNSKKERDSNFKHAMNAKKILIPKVDNHSYTQRLNLNFSPSRTPFQIENNIERHQQRTAPCSITQQSSYIPRDSNNPVIRIQNAVRCYQVEREGDTE